MGYGPATETESGAGASFGILRRSAPGPPPHRGRCNFRWELGAGTVVPMLTSGAAGVVAEGAAARAGPVAQGEAKAGAAPGTGAEVRADSGAGVGVGSGTGAGEGDGVHSGAGVGVRTWLKAGADLEDGAGDWGRGRDGVWVAAEADTVDGV